MGIRYLKVDELFSLKVCDVVYLEPIENCLSDLYVYQVFSVLNDYVVLCSLSHFGIGKMFMPIDRYDVDYKFVVKDKFLSK